VILRPSRLPAGQALSAFRGFRLCRHLAARPARCYRILHDSRSVLIALLCEPTLFAQPPNQPKPELLWPNGAPGALGTADTDKPSHHALPRAGRPRHGHCRRHLSRAVDTSIWRSITKGRKWRNGSTRLASPRSCFSTGWGRAITIQSNWAMRSAPSAPCAPRPPQYRVLPDRIGIMGFSAGGHLASTAETHFDAGNPNARDAIDRVSSRPDFAVLAYPVISLSLRRRRTTARAITCWVRIQIPSWWKVSRTSCRSLPVTPPTFLFHTSTDPVVPVENSVLFYLALRKAGVPAEMHIYAARPARRRPGGH
jgi:hypothetical protein